MNISLANETIVVTGGAKRLGRAIVQELANAGANVAFTYLSSENAARQLELELSERYPGQKFRAYKLEVSQGPAVGAFVRQLQLDFDRVTGLVNCAAIFRRTPFAALEEADFDDHIAANLKGPFLLCKALGQVFQEAGRGSIVNFADIYGIRPLANYVPYCVSKAGIIMLTQALAKALAPTVRVNCICPGTILEPSELQGEKDAREELVQSIPMGRLGTELEIAQTVMFLLNGPQFITGVILPVDGAQILR